MIKVKLLENCARCNESHENLEFHQFTNPVRDLTHWTLCPITKEPILMRVILDDEPKTKEIHEENDG
jgi:hypothetical protein